MDRSGNDFFDLEEVEVLAKKKLPKPVGFAIVDLWISVYQSTYFAISGCYPGERVMG